MHQSFFNGNESQKLTSSSTSLPSLASPSELSSVLLSSTTIMSLLQYPIFLALFLFPLVHANRLNTFSNCLPAAIPFYKQKQSRFNELASANFRNDRATPLAIVRPQTESQVAASVRCARKAKLSICVRSGGHSLAGKSLCNQLLLDVAQLRTVKLLKNNVAQIGAGSTLGEVLWALWNGRKRWFAAGVCPGVGVGGYVFGGGHGPYEGRLAMACDSLVSVRIVDRFANVKLASKTKNKNLFWALCGAGGGQFGVVTSFKVRTTASAPFDRSVVFRFRWNQERIGELMHKWMDYDEAGGDVWFRMEMGLASGEKGMFGYGACYNVASTNQCLNKLKKAAFFNTPTRTTILLEKAKNALDTHAFFGPDGNYARKRTNDLRNAMLNKRYVDKGQANGRIYQSTFLQKKKGGVRMTPAFWQKYADFCANPGRSSIPWVVCELNLFNNAIDKPRNNAFAHRGAHIITHYIVGGGTNADKRFVYRWMKKHLKPFTTGVYVNYPEPELGANEYPKLYWGSKLNRLKKIKRQYDPDLFFINPQPIPRN